MEEKYKKPKWAVKQIIRYDRGNMVEDICKHGIGHPNREWLKKHGKDGDEIHGCDFCCTLKDIPNFEGRYAVTTNGKVWSYPKQGNNKTGMWLKTYEKDGYLYVQPRKNKKHFYKSIHRLVAETHIPNPDNKRVINHKDFNRQNNTVSNLEWMTDSENVQYSYDNGKRPNQKEIARKNGRKMCKLTDNDVKNIKKMCSDGFLTQGQIAKKYKVHKITIHRINRCITYKYIK